jgi:hypothetical protein
MTPEERTSMRNLQSDLDLLTGGWKPDERTLRGAPVLEDWFLTHYGVEQTLSRCGYVTAHPELRGERRPIVASLLAAIDPAPEPA